MTGQKFGPYTILEKLGAGAMGEVYKARHDILNRFVAIKVLTSDRLADPERRRRFIQEARALSALNHPHIIGIYDILSGDGRDLLIMEFVDGKTLYEVIRADRLNIQQAVKYAIHIADALAAAHATGIVHRDLKPANVMIGADGIVKLLDFGVAKQIVPDSGATETGEAANVQTREGVIVGSASYMSPEQAGGRPVDARSDIFALGAVLYEMLTRSRAFESDSAISTLLAVIREEPRPLRTLVDDLPPEVEKIVTRCLRKDPASRFQDAADLKASLENVFAGATVNVGTTVNRRDARIEPAESIAVLPFANLSGDKENEYFSDGLTEEILSALAKVRGLRVASRTSSFAFRGKERSVSEIGAALKVSHVLEGAVRKSGNRVRVTAQLTGAADGFQLWSERFDREMTDIFAIQDEISQAIVDTLKIKLAGEESPPMAQRETADVEAYNAYLKGRYLLRQFTVDANTKAKAQFQQALERDPGYLSAQAGLGICDLSSGVFGWVTPKSVIGSCKLTFLKMLHDDDTVVDVHWAFGTLLALFEHDWVGAEWEFKRALDLEPDSPQAHWTYGYYLLRPMGRLDEALVHLKRAVELDPVTLHLTASLADLHTHRREYDLAIERFQSAIAMDPGYYIPRWLLGSVYSLVGMFQEAVAEEERAAELSARAPLVLGALGAAHAMAGRERHAREVVAELERRSMKAYVPPGAFAWIYAALNETAAALDAIEKAIEVRDPCAVWLPTDPAFDGLRPDPRYQSLIRKLNLK